MYRVAVVAALWLAAGALEFLSRRISAKPWHYFGYPVTMVVSIPPKQMVQIIAGTGIGQTFYVDSVSGSTAYLSIPSVWARWYYHLQLWMYIWDTRFEERYTDLHTDQWRNYFIDGH